MRERSRGPRRSTFNKRSPIKRKGSWCMVYMAGVSPEEPRPHVVCERCGERLVLILPIRLDVIAPMMTAFVKSHSGCLERRTA